MSQHFKIAIATRFGESKTIMPSTYPPTAAWIISVCEILSVWFAKIASRGVDCYDAASYSVLNHYSELSIDRQGAPVKIPDFTKGRWKEASWRADGVTPLSALTS